MANLMIAGRSYANWMYELCQVKKHRPPEVNISEIPQDPSVPKLFECKITIMDSTGAKLFEVTFVGDSKQKAKQGAALEMIREMGYTDEMLEAEALQPKPSGEMRRSVRRALEAREAGAEIELGPSAPLVTELEELKVNYISELKKVCARAGLIKPAYKDKEATGPAHLRAFKIEGKIGGRGVVEDFLAEAYATGKKQEIKNLAAHNLFKKVAPLENEIRQKMLAWAQESEDNKNQFGEEFFLTAPATENGVETAIENLDLSD